MANEKKLLEEVHQDPNQFFSETMALPASTQEERDEIDTRLAVLQAYREMKGRVEYLSEEEYGKIFNKAIHSMVLALIDKRGWTEAKCFEVLAKSLNSKCDKNSDQVHQALRKMVAK